MTSNGQPHCNQPPEERSPALWCQRCAEESAADGEGAPSPWVYFRRAALHPYHLLALAGTAAFCMITGSVVVLLMGFGLELVYLRVVPMLGAFRRGVEAQMEAAATIRAARSREALLIQMDSALRVRFEKLEILVTRIHENARRHGSPVQLALSTAVDPARLTATYVRLAIAHKCYCDYLAGTSRTALQDQIRALEDAERTGTSPERTRHLRAQRLAIAHERAARWDRTREDLDAIGHQLAAIEELIQLMHEQSIAPQAPSQAAGELERFLADLQENEDTFRELAEFGCEHSRVLVPELRV